MKDAANNLVTNGCTMRNVSGSEVIVVAVFKLGDGTEVCTIETNTNQQQGQMSQALLLNTTWRVAK